MNPQPNPHTMDYQKLYRHMAIEHGLFLLDSQMQEIIDIVLEMHNENPEKCTESIERQYKEKGNQLHQVYGAIKEPSNNDQINRQSAVLKLPILLPIHEK